MYRRAPEYPLFVKLPLSSRVIKSQFLRGKFKKGVFLIFVVIHAFVSPILVLCCVVVLHSETRKTKKMKMKVVGSYLMIRQREALAGD